MEREDRTQAGEVLPYGEMAAILERWTSGKTECPTPLESVFFWRRERPAPPAVCLVEPSVVFVVQGKKEMLVGERAFPYGVGRFLLTSLDLPANSRVVEASPSRPSLGFTLRLDLRILSELVAEGTGKALEEEPRALGMAVGSVTPGLLDPLVRLVRLVDEPAALPALSPLVLREIHFRLLGTDLAPRLLQTVASGSRGQRIAKAIDWLKLNYSDTLRIEELANLASMSSSTFHQRFRELTSMSPLQYQKWLRLNEAKRLMVNEDMDVSSASYRVGYESPSQFSREYVRLFGTPPKRDVEEMRRRAALSVA